MDFDLPSLDWSAFAKYVRGNFHDSQHTYYMSQRLYITYILHTWIVIAKGFTLWYEAGWVSI